MKLHGYMMDRLLVPDPKKLTENQKNLILDVFEKLRETEFPSISEQLETGFHARKTIDLLWLKILGYKGPSEELLEKLYASLLNELEIIGRLMGGAQPKGNEE
jgi:hypothetical protein